jgi:phosphatidylinositol kinase/protein kinase (PI-3  family)
VFKKVEKQLPQLTTLDLQYVSPSLLKAKNLELAVPGAYIIAIGQRDLVDIAAMQGHIKAGDLW